MMQIQANAKVVRLAGGHTAVAKILGYTDSRNVWPWTNYLKPFPPHHCFALERHFKGEVTRQELRPMDWQKHWPDLAESAGRGRKRRITAQTKSPIGQSSSGST